MTKKNIVVVPTAISLENLREVEKKELYIRRVSLLPEKDPKTTEEVASQLTEQQLEEAAKIRPTGLAFSGGGIRAACLAFGFTQGLVRNKLGTEKKPKKRCDNDTGNEVFSWFDYLSTVSGGGYTGSLLSQLATKCAEKEQYPQGTDRRKKALDELDPDKLVIQLEKPLSETDKQKKEKLQTERPPFWVIFRHRGRKIGNMAGFISRHVVNTFIFNIPNVSFLVLLTCSLAFLWRLMDDIPITDYLWWASNHSVRESTRPFLVPIALGYVWMLIALARPKNSTWGIWLSLSGYSLMPLIYFGMPFLLFVTMMLLAVWFIQSLYAPKEMGEEKKNKKNDLERKWGPSRKQAFWPALLISIILAWYVSNAYHPKNTDTWSTKAGIGFIIVAVLFFSLRVYDLPKMLFILCVSFLSVIFIVPLCMPLKLFPHEIVDFFSIGMVEYLVPTWLFLAMVIGLSFIVGKNNSALSRDLHRPALIAACAVFFASVLVSIAVWLGSPHMNTSTTPNANLLLDQGYMKYIWPFITALLIPLVQPQRLFRSGQKNAPPTQQWFFNIVSSALLVGLPFLMVYFFAQHNLSGFGSRINRPWLKHDLEFTKLSEFDRLFSDLVPHHKELHREMRRVSSNVECSSRYFPFNDNYVALPLVFPNDPHSRPLFEKSPKGDFHWRSWSAERAAEQARKELAKGLGDEIIKTSFWTLLRAKSSVIDLPKRLHDNILLYGSMDQTKASEINGYRISLSRKALDVLDLTLDEVKSLNGYRNVDIQLGKFLETNRTEIDIEKANILFHVAFADIMSPLGYVRRGIVIDQDQNVRIIIIAISFIVFLLSYYFVNINLTSMQNYYRRQLEDAFLRLPFRHARPSDHEQASELQEPPYELSKVNSTELGFPYQLLHGNIWHCDRQHEPIINNEAFLMSPKYCGSKELKFIPTEEYSKLFGDSSKSGDKKKSLTNPFTLADAMSISGAAVTPYQTEGNILLLSVMTVMNFRTGQWLPHPTKWNEKGSRPEFNPTIKGARKSSIELKKPWQRKATNDCDMVFVADGGYSENLGVKALLERRCQLIVGLDSGADPEGEFENLVNMLKQSREAGYRLEVNWEMTELTSENATWFNLAKQRKTEAEQKGQEMNSYDAVLPARLLEQRYGTVPSPYGGKIDDDAKLEWKQFSTSHFIFFDVTYPVEKGRPLQKGIFIYVRSSLTGDEPERMLLALRDAVPFPNHPTSEQLYDPKLVELYRELGLHLADRMCYVLNQLNQLNPDSMTIRTLLMLNHDDALCEELNKRSITLLQLRQAE